MAWQPDYLSTAQLKSALRITDAADDAELGFAITAASRAIDQHCDRQFGLLAAASEARYYKPRYDRKNARWLVVIDDLMTTVGLVVKVDDGGGTFPTTLVLNTDYRLYPWNAAADARPWTALAVDQDVTFTQGGSASFLDRAIEVTAKFGWTTVPGVVTQACLIQASRFFSRRNSPYGVAGSPEMGSEMRLLAKLDPDVEQLLASVSRNWGVT